MIELVTVLAVIAITVLAISPVIGTSLSDSKTRGAALQVAGALRLARHHAISSAATYRVTLTPTSFSITCINDCPATRPPDTVEPVATGATLSSSAHRISFSPRGAAVPAGTITISYPGAASWDVVVNLPGRVRTCKRPCP